MARQLPRVQDKSGYLSEDTVAALASAPGGAVAVLRISGPQAFHVLGQITPDTTAIRAEPRKLCRVRLIDPEAPVGSAEMDDALSVRFVAPASFTGEDVVELHLHGGSYIAARVLDVLARLGVRQALPGEFSFRAVRNGKMTLSQATAVSDLIAASNHGAVSLALEKLSGSQNRLITDLAQNLRQLAVLGEVGIDFADQDVEEVSLPQLKKRLEIVISALERLQQSYKRGTLIQDGIPVAFSGVPNAGKSSFFNALLGEDRSIVSDIPGTTRDVVREKITLSGSRNTVTLRLEDTAGLRATDNEIERMGIDRSIKSAKDADLVLFLVDSTATLAAALEQWKILGAPGDKALGILTKTDLLPSGPLTQLVTECQNAFGISRWVATSAKTGHGIASAVEAITEFAGQWLKRDPGEVVLTRLNEAQAAAESLEHLQRARDATELDLFAADVRQALTSMGPLIGETLPDDILGKIFSEFCIGK
jgi:tRNA modification GTPase